MEHHFGDRKNEKVGLEGNKNSQPVEPKNREPQPYLSWKFEDTVTER
jgi:hypothetical protein